MKKNIIVILVLLLIYVCIIVCWNARLSAKKQKIATTNQENNVKFDNMGIGFVISKDGYVVTAQHIVEDTLQNKVILYFYDENGRTFSFFNSYVAEVVKQDMDNDCALLKITHRVNKDTLDKEVQKRKSKAQGIQNEDAFYRQEIEADILSGKVNDKNLLENANNDFSPLELCNCNKEHLPGELVRIPTTILINTSESVIIDQLTFLIFTTRIAGSEFNESMWKNVYLDRRSYNGMSGSPVVDSEGKVIAMVLSDVGEFYSRGLSSHQICDCLKFFELNAELQKTVEKSEDAKKELEELRKSIVFVKVYIDLNSKSKDKKDDSSSDNTK